MTLGEDLCRKYSLTSCKARGGRLTLLAINEALEAAAKMADLEHSSIVANRIRNMKCTDNSIARASGSRSVRLRKTA
jgi:hypothetical protein